MAYELRILPVQECNYANLGAVGCPRWQHKKTVFSFFAQQESFLLLDATLLACDFIVSKREHKKGGLLLLLLLLRWKSECLLWGKKEEHKIIDLSVHFNMTPIWIFESWRKWERERKTEILVKLMVNVRSMWRKVGYIKQRPTWCHFLWWFFLLRLV